MTYGWIPTQNFENFHFEKNNLQNSNCVKIQGKLWSLVSFYFFVKYCSSFRFLKALACKMPIKHRNGSSGEYIGQNRCQSGKIFLSITNGKILISLFWNLLSNLLNAKVLWVCRYNGPWWFKRKKWTDIDFAEEIQRRKMLSITNAFRNVHH